MKFHHIALASLAMVLTVALALAQESTDGTSKAGDQSAEEVLSELLQRRAENPIIAPAKPVAPTTVGQSVAAPLGTAPGVKPAQLKREGSFVIMRRGRLIKGEGGMSPWMFAFDADTNGLADPPMFLSPCQALEDMETNVIEHGDGVAFTVSGQVFVYRQANYLLVTLWKLTPRRGNLQP